MITGKIYIGVHSTNNIDDGYVGCGISRDSDAKIISRKSRFYGFPASVVKYGYCNFKKQILRFFNSKEDAYLYEKKIVTKEFIESNRTYNLKLGGEVAPSSLGIKRTEQFKKERAKSILVYMNKLVDIHSKEYVVVDVDTNNTYHVKNLTKFATYNKLSIDGLSVVARGKAQLYLSKWWVCHKKDWTGKVVLKKGNVFKDIVVLYNKDGSKIKVRSLKEACFLTGADRSALLKVINGKANQTAGWSTKNWKC